MTPPEEANPKKARRYRVGGGEYTYEDDACQSARGFFLVRLEEIATDAMADLRTLVSLHERVFTVTSPSRGLIYPVRERAFIIHGEFDETTLPNMAAFFQFTGRMEDLSRLRDELIDWSKKWNLIAPDGWILEAALGRLGQWREPEKHGPAVWGFSRPRHPGEANSSKGHFGVPIQELVIPVHWEAAFITESEFVKQAEAEFKRQLGDYIRMVHDLMEGDGLSRTEEEQRDDHYDWLIAYLTDPDARSIRALAQKVFKDRKTVRESMRELASLLGLSVPSLDKK